MSSNSASVQQLATWLLDRGERLAVAESCTGGLLAAACTALPGSSAWFECSMVTYRLSAKTDLLGVPAALLAERGAVNAAVARHMAEGVLARSQADYSIATTGLAGPDGDGTDVPVGTLWLGWAGADPAWSATHSERLTDARLDFRQHAVQLAIEGLLQRLRDISAA